MASERCRMAAVMIALCLTIWPGSSGAEPSAAEKETAREMMEKGDDAFDSGRHGDALEAYRRADSIVGVPTTGLAVALALEKLGRLRESREVALRVAGSKPAAGEPKLLGEARERAAVLARQLDEAIPTLQVVVVRAPDRLRASLSIDGAVVSNGLSTPVPLDPGEHEYRLTADGHAAVHGRVSLVRNERRRIEHVIARTARAPSRPSSTPALVYLGFSVGAAGALVGTATGIASLSKASSAKDQCEGTTCFPEARADADSAKRYATVSNVSFGIGLTGLAIGVIGLLSSPPERRAKPETLRVEVTPIHAGARVGLVREF